MLLLFSFSGFGVLVVWCLGVSCGFGWCLFLSGSVCVRMYLRGWFELYFGDFVVDRG